MLSRRSASIVSDMAPDRSTAQPVTRRTFLAEHYRAGSSRETARSEFEAAQVAAVQLSLEGRPVTLIGSLLVPSDDTVYSLFGAASRDDVAAVGERTDQPYDRISESVPVALTNRRNR
jgi:hypothetical protein